MDNARALLTAVEYYRKVRDGVKFDKSGAVRELAAFGLFSIKEIALLLEVSFQYAEREVGLLADLGPNNTGRRWNILTLDALYALSVAYANAEVVNSSLVKMVVQQDTSLRAVAELAGIPIGRVREAVYGK